VGIGTTDPAYTLDVNGDIGIVSGSDLYLDGVGLGSTGGAALVGMDNSGLTYVTSSSVQGGIADLDGAINDVSGDIRWAMDGDSGTAQIVGAGQTASFVGGTGISTSVGATRQLTITNTAPWTDASDSYIRNQFASAQTGNFWISGSGLVGTRLGVGATHSSYVLNVDGTSRFTNNLTVTSGGVSVTGNSTIAGTLSSLTGLTSSGTITFSNLTANRLVTTTTGGELTNSISADNLRASVTETTGTGSLVFGTSPAITTSLTTGSASFDLINTTATTVNFARAATALTMGATSGTTTIQSPTLVGSQTTQNLYNTVATTLNIGGAATALNLGATTGTTTIKTPTLALDAASSTLNFSSSTGVKQIQTGGTTHLALMPGGNVGVGTTNPNAPLEIYKEYGATIGEFLRLHSDSNADGSGTQINFYHDSVNSNRIETYRNPTTDSKELAFYATGASPNHNTRHEYLRLGSDQVISSASAPPILPLSS